jgi:glycosyltransferase involved in cell wall biosynthesis
MGAGTELIFVEGHSTDDTFGTIQKAIEDNPQRSAKLFRQEGKGKGDAVRLGFKQAAGDILMILEADLTAPPENLPRFYNVIAKGKAEFVNGVRLVYPLEKEAMRFLNLLGSQ